MALAQVSSIHTACLEEVQRAVEGVVAQHRDTPEPAVFLCNIQLDQLTRSEKVDNTAHSGLTFVLLFRLFSCICADLISVFG